MSGVIVHKTEQAIQPHVTFDWDAEGSTVSCEVAYPTRPSSEERKISLRDQLDRQFNITHTGYIITGGMLSVALDSQKRIKDWDIYTNPARWIKCTFPFVEVMPTALYIEASFDENRHGEDMGEPVVFYEPVRGTFYLSWGEVSTWFAIALALAIGVANDNTLRAIRLDGLRVQTGDRVSKGPWKKLRHRFGC